MKTFSPEWKGSKKARKQRKYRAHLPLHLRQKLMHIHLSNELRQKYKKRNVTVKAGDTIKIMRGQFKKKEGKVERVDRKGERLFVTGVEILKKDGTKVLFPVHPSNALIVQLDFDDKRRREHIEQSEGVKK